MKRTSTTRWGAHKQRQHQTSTDAQNDYICDSWMPVSSYTQNSLLTSHQHQSFPLLYYCSEQQSTERADVGKLERRCQDSKTAQQCCLFRNCEEEKDPSVCTNSSQAEYYFFGILQQWYIQLNVSLIMGCRTITIMSISVNLTHLTTLIWSQHRFRYKHI